MIYACIACIFIEAITVAILGIIRYHKEKHHEQNH